MATLRFGLVWATSFGVTAMDSEFIAPRELILGGVGIGVALVLLVVLSLLQQRRLKKAGEERLEELESQGAVADAPAGTIPFFVGIFNGNNARFFRVYEGPGELLFVNAGQYFALIDVESARGTDQRHWLLRSMKLVGVGLAGGAVAAGIGVAAIVRGVARNAANNPTGARDIMMMVFGIIAFLAVMVVLGVPLMLWQVTRRCRQLDPMSLARLRQEAELDTKSFRATPETISEFKVKLLDQRDNFVPSSEVGSTITFKHSVTGRWTITTLATRDTRAALAAFRSIWGAESVNVDLKLRERLGEPLDGSEIVDKPSIWQKLAAPFDVPPLTPEAAKKQPIFWVQMLVGFAIAAVIALGISIGYSAAAGRFRYTLLAKLLFSLCGSGTYLGHIVGVLQHKELGISLFGQMPGRTAAIGAAIWVLGSAAVLFAVMGIMTVIYGPPPH